MSSYQETKVSGKLIKWEVNMCLNDIRWWEK